MGSVQYSEDYVSRSLSPNITCVMPKEIILIVLAVMMR